jgi:Asp-tRNA(Asn)/Glu-tRNA(Gln) amidotransferase A subunit family amidase
MNKEDICFMSACDMKDAILSQELTSQEITETLIERIEKINPLINAYCTPTFEIARETAKKADQAVKKSEKLGMLHGIPTSIKDLFLTKGIRTTLGSLLYENNIPEDDEVVVKRLKEAGIVILGKTNTPEFGYAGVTHNLIFGKTRNPWNTERIPGGSSGGGAAAVASGLGPLALGNDGGGSVRIPAACCGVFGHKPSLGRVPVFPRIELHAESYVHIGPIVRYVKDAALMLDAIKGPHDGDRYSLPDDKTSYLENISNKPDKLKIGYSIDLGYAKIIDPDIEKNVINSAKKFEELGWSVENVKLKIKKPNSAFYTFYTADYAYDLKSKLKDWRDKIDPELIKMVDAGFGYTGFDIMRAMSQRTKLYETFYEFFKNYDILITPTIAIPPFELGIMFPPQINGKNVSPTAWMPFTFPFNFTGHPAASIPCGWTNDGLPIGMQIIGNRFKDLLILQVSKAFEEIAPWQEKRPKLN